MSRSPRWSIEEFAAVVQEVLLSLPGEFSPWLENLVVDVEERPSRQLLKELGAESPDELMGLFVGHAITRQEYGEHLPNRIVLFRQSLQRAARTREELAYEVRRTVLHELAHHFGYEEDDLDDFESQPSPFDADDDEEAGDGPWADDAPGDEPDDA